MGIRKFILAVAVLGTTLHVIPDGVSAHEVRIWTDNTGKHTTKAEFVSLKDGEVTLRRVDGKLIKTPLKRLSKEDQAHIAKLESEQHGSDAPTDEAKTVEDRRKIRLASKGFFRALVQEDEEAIKEAITAAAGKEYESGDSPIKKMPTPDKGIAFRVGKIEIKDETATCDVRVRLNGKFQRTTLNVRREGDTWKIYGISADGPDGETVSFDFEGKKDAAPSVGDTSDEPSDESRDEPSGGTSDDATDESTDDPSGDSSDEATDGPKKASAGNA